MSGSNDTKLATWLRALLDLIYAHVDAFGAANCDDLLQSLDRLIGPAVGLWLDQHDDKENYERATVSAALALTACRGIVHALRSGEIDTAISLSARYLRERFQFLAEDDRDAHTAN